MTKDSSRVFVLPSGHVKVRSPVFRSLPSTTLEIAVMEARELSGLSGLRLGAAVAIPATTVSPKRLTNKLRCFIRPLPFRRAPDGSGGMLLLEKGVLPSA